MPTPLLQPALVFNFNVVMWDVQSPDVAATIAGTAAGQVIFGSFSEVQGLESSVEIETYQEGGLNDRLHKFIKTAKFPNLVLKRGVTVRGDLWDWHAQVLSGQKTVIRKSGMIILFDRNGPGSGNPDLGGLTRVPIAAWLFERGLPEKLQAPGLDAKGNNVAIETLEISHERLTRIGLSSLPKLGDVASSFPGLS